jgi:DNA polymerase III alpha subunit
MGQSSTLDQVIQLLGNNYIKERIDSIKKLLFLSQECSILLHNRLLIDYYQYIIKHKNINKENSVNSFIMWIYGVVDVIDMSRPTTIVPSYISLPDIDMDVPATKRDDVILYLKNKYGHDKVSQMITFGRLQGKSAIKEVLRVHEACSFAEMNAISNCIPDEAKISDQLAEMDDEDRSIIKWALINNCDTLSDFCKLSEEGDLEGDYAEYFRQAINIEGTFKSQGKHAAGIVISAESLSKVCPMVKQKGAGEKIAGLEMSDLEALGHVKFDILGISLLDKLMYISTLNKEHIHGKS